MTSNGGNMLNINGNTPSINDFSKKVEQLEIQNAKQNMNAVASQNMILGAELASNITSQVNLTNSVPSLNGSTSVDNKELQEAKNSVQNSGNSKRF
jgi:hypothetical protein